ncbi:MAG: flavodoxin [Clostridia bacterium]|nr:flavodoxin [Clostridia bacterium]
MNRILVAYFSASGVTKDIAQKLASAVGADLFEIVPERPYTKADLNWLDKRSRSTVEMKDRSCRPAIAFSVDDMDSYSTVFLGFPVWWFREPSIIDTFMESYNFDGVKVIPFCTSGGSKIGDTYKNLQALAHGADVAQGERIPMRATVDEIRAWALKYIQ